MTVFTVVAGKYDGSERNYKYISEPFTTLAEAEEDLKRVSGYPFAEIEITVDIQPSTQDGD